MANTGLGLPPSVRACLFDLDGVLTDTAAVHAETWRRLFDDYLRARARARGEPFVPSRTGWTARGCQPTLRPLTMVAPASSHASPAQAASGGYTPKQGLPPGSRLPAVIQTPWYVSRPRSFFSTMRGWYGDTFTGTVLNGKIVVGCTPAHARQMFTAEPRIFRTFAAEALSGVLGEGSLLVAWGEPHRRARKLLQPPFHGARMRAYGAAMREVALEHTRALSRGQEVRLHDVTTRISLDVILRTVFGMAGAELDEGRSVLQGVMSGFSPMLVFSRQLQTPLLPAWRRFLSANARYEAMLDGILARRMAGGERGEDILGMMIEARWDDGSAMTRDELRGQLLTLLFAGHETTAIALAWALHDVYRRPAVLARLRDEVAALGDDPDPDALARLPYLGAVCDESLRFRPIVTDTVRTLLEPFEYGGHVIPAGTGLCLAIELIHRDPSVYPDPDSFVPERFLEKRPSPFEFLPFGGGHRRCLGAAFSDHEARIVLGTLVRTLDVTTLGEDERVRRNIIMGPRRGVPARVLRVER